MLGSRQLHVMITKANIKLGEVVRVCEGPFSRMGATHLDKHCTIIIFIFLFCPILSPLSFVFPRITSADCVSICNQGGIIQS